jgi:hypothetical protein
LPGAAAKNNPGRQEVVAGMALNCPTHAIFELRSRKKRSKNRNADSDVVAIGKSNLPKIVFLDDPGN